jgi:dolichol-phosphate mannosyltransferase
VTIKNTLWQTPAYEELVFGQKTSDYALVIPVINEGERIRRQLARIADFGVQSDIVIADGGSSDGSLEARFLKSIGVRALLMKRGPGGLSAQLRMSYAWCLDEGYRGVVTMDGNDKDGGEAIGRFIERLEEGYDYVQGSRYRPGGRAIDTPLDRKLAGRLIHTPLLSFAGRHRYTDTTNGFRAYSAQYLRDPCVAPFRDVFDRYALLFYLTMRAGQLGYRICEIPVTRAYPRREKTPTKISGFKGRLAMFRELWHVVNGHYNPRDEPCDKWKTS